MIADAPALLETVPNRESYELRWVAEDEVAGLLLHPGFAASWHRLRISAAVPPHTCALDLPHPGIAGAGFAWCAAGVSAPPAHP